MKVTEAPINNSQLYIEEIETVPEEFTYTSPKDQETENVSEEREPKNQEDLVSTKVLNNIRKLENVINILSEPQDKKKKVKYIGKILKYVFTFVVTVMTLAAAIIPIMTFYSSTPITSEMTTKNWNSSTLVPITTTTTKTWNITTTTTAVTTSVSVCEFEEIDVQSSDYSSYNNIPDAKTCHGLCLKHQYCEFFVWVSPDFGIPNPFEYNQDQSNECWLKWGHIYDEYIKLNVASNYRLCKPPVCKFKQIDLDSANYFGHSNIPDPETCHSLCLNHEYCEFFVWISPEFIQSNECILKWGSLTDSSFKADVYANYRSC